MSFDFEVIKGSHILNDNGRITSQPEFSEVVTYKVTTGSGKSITLSSIVPGIYTK